MSLLAELLSHSIYEAAFKVIYFATTAPLAPPAIYVGNCFCLMILTSPFLDQLSRSNSFSPHFEIRLVAAKFFLIYFFSLH